MEANSVKETAPKGGKKDYALLDLIQDPTFVVDTDKKVIYANETFANLVAKKREQVIGSPIGSLIKAEESGVDEALATGDKAHILTWAVIKEKKYFLETEPSPLLDEKGSIIGVLGTIKDLTGQKLVMLAVHDLVARAKAGELSARADVKADGDYKLLVDDVNEMLDALISPLKVAEDYIDRISKGDIPEKITGEYSGEFNTTKNNLNNLIGEMHILVDEVGVVIGLAREGNLAKRADPDRTKGVYRKILRGFNDALDALINPLKVAEEYVDRISKGDIPEQITANYNGDFNIIKNNLNNLIGEITGVTGEMGNLVSATSKGVLTKRGDAGRFQGAYKEMVQDMNGLIDSMAGPISELMATLNRLSNNDYTQKMVKEYSGVWDELKGVANETISRLLSFQDAAIRVGNGDLSRLDELQKIVRRCENDQLIPAFIRMMETIKNLIGEIDTLTRAVTTGDLSKKGNEKEFQGAYREIIEDMNGLMESVTNPLNEVLAVLGRMALNDTSQKVIKDYSGVWNDLKTSTNLAIDRVTNTVRIIKNISKGDLSDLDGLKR